VSGQKRLRVDFFRIVERLRLIERAAADPFTKVAGKLAVEPVVAAGQSLQAE
jgi:hypothetical protein